MTPPAPLSRDGVLKGCALALAAIAVILATVVWFVTHRQPDAVLSATRLGMEFRVAVSDLQIREWAARISTSTPPENDPFQIPPAAWPSEIQRFFKDRFAVATLYFDKAKHPSGITFACRDVGIVIPLNGVLPDRDYFCLYRIADSCPYFAFCDYND